MGPAPFDARRAYKEHLAFLLSFARTLGVRRAADREDVVHDVFCIAIEKQDTYDTRRATERAWLAGIAYHECQRWRRLVVNRRGHVTGALDERRDEGRDPEQLTGAAQLEALTRSVVDELPEHLRIALELVDFHGFTFEETAQALQAKESTVKGRVYKARDDLERRLKKLRKIGEDDVRGAVLPVPPDPASVFEGWRSSSTAVEPTVAARVWERILGEPRDVTTPARDGLGGGSARRSDPGASMPVRPRNDVPPVGTPPASSARPAHFSDAVGAAVAVARLASPTVPVAKAALGVAAAKIGGTVAALVAAAGAGAAIHAAATSPDRSPVIAVVAETSVAQPFPPVLPSGSAVVAELPGGAPASAAVAVSSGPRVSPSLSSSAAGYDSEADLMERMRQALASNPTEALRLADRHLRLYPKKNGQSREVITILALARTGQRAAAKARADAFRAAYPNSPQLATIDAALGGGQ